MLKQFIFLEWRAFFRSASFGSKLIFKILAFLAFLYFAFVFSAAGVGLFFGLKKAGLEPLSTVNRFLFYYWAADLVFRFLLQNMPVTQIQQPTLGHCIAGGCHFGSGCLALLRYFWCNPIYTSIFQSAFSRFVCGAAQRVDFGFALLLGLQFF